MENKKLMECIWQDFYISLPVCPHANNNRSKLDKNRVYGVNIFEQMNRTQTTWEQFEKMLEDFKNVRNKYIGYNLGNSNEYLICGSKRFIFMITSGGEFHVWDEEQQFLGEFDLGKDYKYSIPTQDFISWISHLLTNYCNGIVKCSDCGAEIKESDIAGRYFAGIYCKDCWNRKWKAIEANETYD